MRTTKFYQRLLAFVLSLAMLLPMAPVSARAESTTAAAGIVISETISVPAYPGSTNAKISNVMEYDCGNGVSGKGEKSYLTIVTGTTSAEFLAYRDVLEQAGYMLVMENEVASDDANDPNRFASYRSPDGSYKVYTYHFPFYQETRIIVDTQKDTVAGFSYTAGKETVQPMMAMYGLSMSENGYDNTTTTAYSTDKRNCGALVVIRMPDNSLFIHDGGDLEQWSDEACDRFLQFCRELTGKGEGEKMVINTWFLSHAHTDHYLGLPRFFSKYHDKFDLKYIMYNIDIERTNTTRDIHGIMSMVSSYYPNVKYYKPHTGESFSIAGIGFDVIYAPEDRYLPNENGELITDYPYDVGGTYRDFCYDTSGDPTTESDFNDTSVVLRVHMDENTDALLYADLNRTEQVLFDIYPDSALETDIMMIPHHGFDSHPKLCELSKAKVFLFTQHRGAIYGADGDLTTKDPDGQYRPKLYNNYMEMREYIETEGSKTYWAGNETVCLTVGDSASVVPEGMTQAEAPTGFTAYTAPAYSFAYEGWTVDGSDDTTISGDWQGTFPEVETTNHLIRYKQVTNGVLDESQRYVIVHSATNQVLLHDAVAQKTSSLPVGTPTDASDGKVVFFNATNDTTRLYSPHYYRDQAMWKLENLYSSPSAMKSVTAKFGGTSAYRYSMYVKGLNPEDGAFWYTTAADTDATRALQPNREEITLASPTSQNTYTEFFDDGTCLVYYYKSDGTDVRFLTCDEDGNWKQKIYTSDAGTLSDIEKELANLKLRLYAYEEQSSIQTVAYEGTQDYMVLTTVNQAETVSLISSGIRVMDTSRRNLPIPCSGTTPKVGYYYLQFPENYKAGVVGDYLVKVQYRNDDGTDTYLGAVAVHVIEKIAISGARLDIAGTVSKNAGVGAVPQVINSKTGETTPCRIEVTYNTANGHVTRMVPLSVGMLTDSEGKPIDTSIEGVYPDLTITYQGVKLNGTFTLTVTGSNDVLNYPLYPEEGSVRVTKQGITTLGEFSTTGVANIQLSATGKPTSNGVDLIIVMDLSGSMRYGLDTTSRVDQENYEATRLFAMEQSLKQMVTMLRNSGADVRIAMSDFGDLDSHEFEGAIIDYSIRNNPFFDVDFSNAYERSNDYTADFYEFSNYLNFPMKAGDKDAVAYTIANSKFNLANPSYTGKVIPTIYTGSKEANAEAFVDVKDLDDAAMDEIIGMLDVDITKSNGTNYDVGLEYAYHLGMAIQQKNIAEGQDRDLVVIFMSDGAPMQFNYFSGRTLMSTWPDWFTGNADGITSLNYSVDNPPEGLTELDSALLDLLKAGKLINPLYRRDGGEYFAYDATKITADHPYFYTYMDELGYDLDWQYLVDIAKANGMPNFDYDAFLNNKMLPELTALLKEGKLVNPYYSADQIFRYYDKYTGTATSFFAAMEELEYDIGWDEFAKIAYRNRNYDRDGTNPSGSGYGEIGTLLMALLDNVRDVPEGSYYTLSPYAYFYNPDGLNWWAEAIKGKTTELYPVINKYAYTNSTERPFAYYGDVRNNFSGETTKNLPLDGKDYIGGFRGLDADIYSVSFSIANEYEISTEDADTVMRRIATGPSYFFAANTQEGLTSALKAIASTISSGASDAWYSDTMGPEFDLSTSKTVEGPNGEMIEVNAEPMIRVLEYDVDETGYRTGEPNVREVVKFQSNPGNPDQEMRAWSNQVFTTEVDSTGKILNVYSDLWGDDGIIRAKYFYYNTNKYVDETNTGTVKIDTNGDGEGDYDLPAETFLWSIGVIGETEMVLDYEVYLTGSMENVREEGLYDTNTHAELSYINYLGNNCQQEVPTPKYPWKQGSVGYAFYLVNRNGEPIINEETGVTGTFELSVELTDIIYEKFDLNTGTHTLTADELMTKLVESGEMPEGYTLYDPKAEYTVTVDTEAASGQVNGTYSVEIGVERPTTWISGLGFDDVLPTESGKAYEVTDASTANTVVWFAVYVEPQTNPDVVVIDYGIPVNIHVMANDLQMPSKHAELAAIGALQTPGYVDTLGTGFGDTYTGMYGTASIVETDASDAIIRYTLNTTNGMQMSAPETFSYAVDYAGPYSEVGYYYETITIIPAANIYYEDSHLNFTDSSTEATGGIGVWQEAKDFITVSCYNAGNWNEVYAYCKGDSGPAGTWPGVKMTDNDHDNIYTGYVSADQVGKMVMFNNGDKAYQTGDLPITDDGVYKVDNSWYVNSSANVYFNNADGWDKVYAYWWAGSTNNGWPGMEMSYSESTGLYSINVPAGMTNIIFNNNAGTQTADLSIVDNGLYQPDGSVTPRTNGDSVKTVYFDTENCPWSTVNAYWWNANNSSENNGWPGTPMSYTGYSGLYSIEVPGNMTHIIFNNNKDGEKGHNLGEQTIEKDGEVYCDLRWEYSTADVDVIFDNTTSGWDDVYVYFWSYGNTSMTSWPGVKMTRGENNRFTASIPVNAEYVIFSNGTSQKQTPDIRLAPSGTIYFPDGSQDTTDAPPRTYYYSGDNWDDVYAYTWDDYSNNGWPGEKMKYDEETGLYSITVTNSSYHYIIFTNGKKDNALQQTNDLSLPASGSIYHGDIWVGYEGDPTIQDEDRPGVNEALKNIDANNVYGYDSAYGSDGVICTRYSLGSARMVTVNAATGKPGNAPKATFTFTGTGFDVVGVTDSDSGAIWVEVTDQNGNTVTDLNGNRVSYIVNTYYGYTCNLYNVTYTFKNGIWVRTETTLAAKDAVEQKAVKSADAKHGDTAKGIEYVWMIDPNATDCLYQVPVIKVENLPYGTYNVTIRAAYLTSMNMDMENVNGEWKEKDDEGNWVDGSYTVWLDAIRIYNPAKNNSTSNEAYEKDGESNPVIITIKDELIKKDTFDTATGANGIIYVDGKSANVTIDDYMDQGPNNETYLKPGNGVAFTLVATTTEKPLAVHVGAKLAKGSTADLYLGDTKLQTIQTATNMFYNLENLSWSGSAGNWKATVILSCQSTDTNAILSLTDLKITSKEVMVEANNLDEEDSSDSDQKLVYLLVDEETAETAIDVLSSLRFAGDDDTTEGDNDTTTGGDNTTEGGKTEEETTQPTTKPSTGNNPSTGGNKQPVQDSSNATTGDNVMLFVMLMLFSLMGIGAATILRKKEEI